MTSKSRKVARPTTRSPNEDPDPVGFGTTLAEMIAGLQDAYRARLQAFLRKFTLLQLSPAVRRSIFAVVTARGRPVTFDIRITFYPPDASGFYRAVGALETSSAELWDEQSSDQEPDDPEYGPYVHSIFSKEPVRMRRPKRGWRKLGQRR